jgi:hypothetical protein
VGSGEEGSSHMKGNYYCLNKAGSSGDLGEELAKNYDYCSLL